MKSQDRFEVLLEDLHSKMDGVIEIVGATREDVSVLKGDITEVKSDIKIIKGVIREHSADIAEFKVHSH